MTSRGLRPNVSLRLLPIWKRKCATAAIPLFSLESSLPV